MQGRLQRLRMQGHLQRLRMGHLQRLRTQGHLQRLRTQGHLQRLRTGRNTSPPAAAAAQPLGARRGRARTQQASTEAAAAFQGLQLTT